MFAAVIVCLVAVGTFAANVLSTVRAYVGGEGLWSKGQKDAVYNLVQYAYSGNEHDFEAYEHFLAVPLADRRAREELEKPNADIEVANRAFIEGRNDPDEVRGMSMLFRRFRHVSYIDRAIEYWRQGDVGIAELQGYAQEVRTRIRSNTLTPEYRAALLRRIDDCNRRLTDVEDHFSFTLGEAARWLREVILAITVLGAGICLFFSLMLSSTTSRQIVTGIRNLHEGTARVSSADFERRIDIASNDELGQLAADFNRMTDNLVTAHKQRAAAETALAQRALELERINQQLIEAQAIGKIGSWEWDIEANTITWSDELYRIYGQTREAFSREYQGFLQHVHPEDRARVGAVVEDARENKTSFAFEHRILRPDGEVRWVHGQGRSITNAEGKLVRMAGTSLDITERMMADEARVRFLTEQAARRTAEGEQRRAELLAEASALLSSSLDYAETVEKIGALAVPRFADLCVVRLLAAQDDEKHEAHDLVAHVKPDMVEVVRELGQKFRQNAVSDRCLAHVMKTGTSSWMPQMTDSDYQRAASNDDHLRLLRAIGIRSLITVPMMAHGEPLGGIVFAMSESNRTYVDADVSLAEELGRRAGLAIDNARLYRVARAAIAARDEFLSIASHELRTPLTPLQLQLDALQAGLGVETTDPKLVKKIETAARQVRRLTRLVDGLLDVSRLSAGRLHLEREPTDLGDVVRDVCERFAAEARSQKCEIRIHADKAVVGSWDAVRIDQIVVNLLSNALKYGSGHPIDITTSETADFAQLCVRDSGIGIDADKMHRIFDRFERAVSQTAYGGLGLGLYITKQLVEAHGGGVWAAINEGSAGVTFTVELPKQPLSTG
ncbi:MAG: PAS domain-containing protein [Sandaracinaceae bacterium]|nr:PAS domain-containing protein [Sandaracinaceae bacterium]